MNLNPNDFFFQYNTRYQSNGSRQGRYEPPLRAANQLEKAYRTLGVTSSTNDGEVKKAYRKLMSQNHPDKLVSKGLPEEMIKLATQKTQEIKLAYETICKARR